MRSPDIMQMIDDLLAAGASDVVRSKRIPSNGFAPTDSEFSFANFREREIASELDRDTLAWIADQLTMTISTALSKELTQVFATIRHGDQPPRFSSIYSS